MDFELIPFQLYYLQHYQEFRYAFYLGKYQTTLLNVCWYHFLIVVQETFPGIYAFPTTIKQFFAPIRFLPWNDSYIAQEPYLSYLASKTIIWEIISILPTPITRALTPYLTAANAFHRTTAKQILAHYQLF